MYSSVWVWPCSFVSMSAVSMRICVYLCMCVYVCTRPCVYVCVCVCLRTSLCVCGCVYAHVCVCVWREWSSVRGKKFGPVGAQALLFSWCGLPRVLSCLAAGEN